MAEFTKLVYLSVMGVCLLLTAKDLFSGSDPGGTAKEIPQMKVVPYAGPTLQFLFCGDNYPPPPYRLYLAQFFGIGKIILIVMIISGFNPFSYFGSGTPRFYSWFLENKLYACMMIFFLSNALEGQFISTGAFEISFNGVPVWSKLESGRIPSPAELFQIIDSHLHFSTFPSS